MHLDSIFSAMQLASNGSHGEDNSETEPILSQSQIVEESTEATLFEIRTVDGDTRTVTDVDADESCSLVNSEQAQCRICLDNEGLLEPVELYILSVLSPASDHALAYHIYSPPSVFPYILKTLFPWSRSFAVVVSPLSLI